MNLALKNGLVQNLVDNPYIIQTINIGKKPDKDLTVFIDKSLPDRNVRQEQSAMAGGYNPCPGLYFMIRREMIKQRIRMVLPRENSPCLTALHDHRNA